VTASQLRLDRSDRVLLNQVQGGFPVISRPYREIGERIGMDEAEVIERLRRLLDSGGLSRFGAILSPVGLGGERTLAAMHVPPERFNEVTALVNAHPAISHNYAREHHYNMWFVVSSEDEGEVARTLAAIERETGLEVLNLPTLEEYFVEFNFPFPED
jgi:DNA-binding Lrp family transcriptional regulator